jgi:2-polyprenyl-3-methyl-5-hydroxy-6-metoxy-1,4-benzoquinol methylase
MTAEELDTFYTYRYSRVYQGEEGPTSKDLFVQNRRADTLLAFLSYLGISPSRCLDIGCSSGVLLQRFQERFGCEVIGIEPGEAYRECAQAHGLIVYPDILDLLAASEATFDLISMVHVLEHLPDPVGYLTSLRERHLTPSGWLLIEVPNLYAHDSFEIAHLTSFSAHTLQQVLKKAGYGVVTLKKHGRPRSRLLPIYLTALARVGERGTGGKVVPERAVALKYRLGQLRRRAAERLFPHRAWVSVRDGKE